MADARVRYVNRWRFPGSPQPFKLDHTLMQFFVLEADIGRLRDLCHRHLTAPTGGRLTYEPVAPFVMLTFSIAGRQSSVDEDHGTLGWSMELGCSALVLTAALKNGMLDHLAWFVPYIWVDNPLALTLGREVYGFPKELGWPDIPSDPRQADRFGLDVFASRRKHASNRMTRFRLLEVERVDEGTAQAAPPDPAPWDLPGSIVPGIRSLLGGGTPASRVPNPLELPVHIWDLLNRNVPLVFLKQFPAADDGAFACYQAVVETRIAVDTLRHAAPFPGRFTFRHSPCESHPLHDDLGLGIEQPVLFGFWVDFDGRLDRGSVLWRAP